MQVVIKGELTDIFPAEVIGNLEKRVAWVKEVNEQYPQHYSLEFLQGDCNMLDNFVPGDLVECKVHLRGRRWEKNGRVGVMNTLKCWNMCKVGDAPKPTPSTRQQTGGIPPKTPPVPPARQDQWQAPPIEGAGGEDDLPF